MSYIFGKLWHSAIIWPIRKSFQCILQVVRFLLAKQTRLFGTSDNESYTALDRLTGTLLGSHRRCHDDALYPARFSLLVGICHHDISSQSGDAASSYYHITWSVVVAHLDYLYMYLCCIGSLRIIPTERQWNEDPKLWRDGPCRSPLMLTV